MPSPGYTRQQRFVASLRLGDQVRLQRSRSKITGVTYTFLGRAKYAPPGTPWLYRGGDWFRVVNTRAKIIVVPFSALRPSVKYETESCARSG